MAFPAPPENKSAVRRAGMAVASGSFTDDDVALIDQWRGAHGFALNTFQVSLRRRINGFKHGDVDFVQRLKRRRTVIDKLARKRPDGSPLVRDVTTMNDFAGCRLIFGDLQSLHEFRKSMHEGFAEHRLKNDVSSYDYISAPKSTGYRGIHDIYLHHPRPHRKGDASNAPWQGLKVEIQYRTRIQNSWATAVELADLIDGERTKFELGNTERSTFFSLASEILAREKEGESRAYLGLTVRELREKLDQLEQKLSILSRLRALRAYDGTSKLGKHNVFNIVRDLNEQHGFKLEIEKFDNPTAAMEAANRAESCEDSINAVYVRADNPSQLRVAYKNYFADSVSFVELIDS